jgi:Lrp/AsnC family leucine-responsive transcriptional regulator
MPTTMLTTTSTMPTMDDVDRRLVDALRADGRASYTQLGRLVGLSAPSVQERVRRLERRGVILGYHATVDPAAIGQAVTALVGVSQIDSAELSELTEGLSAVTEIEDCFFVAGENAYLLKIRVPDLLALEATVTTLQRVPGVARTRTTIVLSTKWEHRQVPIASGSAGHEAQSEVDP